jgi:hypothetical protein
MKHVTETVQSVHLRRECPFELDVLLYSTLQYYVEEVGSTVRSLGTLSDTLNTVVFFSKIGGSS